MNNEEKKQAKGYMKELSARAEWIGEDDSAACVSSTKYGALLKFKRLIREDIGYFEAKEMKLDEIGIGWLHLVSELSEEEKNGEFIECESYISYKDPSPYVVWTYNT